jgi:hypothetical protein
MKGGDNMGYVSVLLVILGLLMIFKPSIIWGITESWKSNDSTEPSDLYKISTRFGGGLFSLVGLGGILATWIL